MAEDRVRQHPGLAAESLGSKLERWSFAMAFGIAGSAAGLLLLAPTLIVLVTSFTDAYSLKFPPPGYSTRWYEALWNDSPEILEAAQRSLEVAAIATACSTVLAVAAALALALGLALLMLFNLSQQPLSTATLVIGHVAITAPYILRTTSASLAQLDPVLLESARSLGAGPLFAFRTVTLPLIARGIAAGAFIAFMASFDNVAISRFLSDARSEMLPIRLWHIIESNLDVRAAAASGALIAGTIVLMLVMERIAGISRHLR